MKRQLLFTLSCLFCLLTVKPLTPLLLSAPGGAESDKTIVIAVVKEMGIDQYDDAEKGFREVLAKEKIKTSLVSIDRNDRKLIARVKELQPALILTMGSAATLLLADEIKDIPIIYSMVMDPEGSGILSRNIVGAVVDIPVKMQLETLREVVPGKTRVGVVYNPAENDALIREARVAAQELGLTLMTYPVTSETQIPDIGKLPIDLLWIIPDNMVSNKVISVRFIQDGIKYKKGVIGFSRSYARSGALIGISCDYPDIGRQSAELAVKLIRGENYDNLKSCEPRVIKLYLNSLAADLLGISFPESVITKASEVF